jgi:hypothetical protein
MDTLLLTVIVPLVVTRVVEELESVTEGLGEDDEDAVKDALCEVKKEAVERVDCVGTTVEDTEELAETETEPETVPETETEDDSESTLENDGEAEEEKQLVGVSDAETLPLPLTAPVAVRTRLGETEGLAECVELALIVGDTVAVVESVAVW